MANLTSTLTVRLIDAVSAPARAAAASILGIGKATGATNAAGMAGFGASMAAMAKQADRVSRGLTAVAASMRGFSTTFAVGGAFAAKQAYDFAKLGNQVQAVTQITKAQREQLERYAGSLSATLPFSGSQVMQSALELGRGGFRFEQIMGTLAGTLKLAAAGAVDLQTATDISTNVLTAMRFPMKTTEQAAASLARINDVLSYAANNSNISVEQLGETFKYVGPMAAAAGINLEDVAAAAMVLGDHGIRASEAGVALRSMIVRMVKPTKDMQAVLVRHNIDLKEFIKGGRQVVADDIVNSLAVEGINAKPLAAQIDKLLKDPKLKGSLSALTQRIVSLFGDDGAMDKSKLAENISDALTAAGSEVDMFGFLKALSEKGIDLAEFVRIADARQGARLISLISGINNLMDLRKRLEKEAVGSADKNVEIQMQGIVGAVARFSASITNRINAIAKSGVMDAATNALRGFAGAIEKLAAVRPELLKWGTGLAVIGALVSPALMGLAVIAKALKMIAAGAAMLTGGAGLGMGAGAAAAAGAGTAAGILGRRTIMGLLGPALPWVGAGYLAYEGGKLAWDLDAGGVRSGTLGWINRHGAELDNANARGEQLRLFNQRHEQMSPEAEAIRSFNRRHEQGPTIPAAPDAAAAAADETMAAYSAGLDHQMSEIERKVDEFVQRMLGKLSFTARPSVRLGIEGSDLRGVHGDVGVDVAR